MDSLINRLFLRILVILFLCIGCINSNPSPITTVTIKEIKGELSLCVIDKEDGKLRRIFTDNKSIEIVYQESVGDSIILKGKNRLWEMTTEGTNFRRLFESRNNIINPVLSPNRRKIAFVKDNEIWIKEIGSERLRKIVSLPSNVLYYYGLSFSPEGNKLAFIGGGKSPFKANLWVVDCDEGSLIQLTSGDNIGFQDNSLPLSWSSEGNNIFITQLLEDGREYIAIVNVDRNIVKYLPVEINIDSCRPVWSPKGDEIAFVGSKEQESSNLWRFNLKNNTITQLTKFNKNLKVYGEISYSPDGQEIAFVVFDGKNYNLWIVNTDGSKLRKITNSIKRCKWDDYRCPRWSNDGKRIFCLNNRVFKIKMKR